MATTAAADAKKKNSLDLQKVRERFKTAQAYWDADMKEALDDLKFRKGDHWPAKLKAERELTNRPCLVVDKLNQYVRQVVNDGRQNRPSILVRPVDSQADVATASVFQGMIRHIEDSSSAGACYDTALDGAASCGRGAFRVLSRYVGDNSFDQELYISRIRNHLSVIHDPDTLEADCSDMKFCFIVDSMSKEAFEAEWPGKIPQDWETNSLYRDWYGKTVTIAEYWEVREVKVTLHMMKDGSIVPEEKLAEFRKAGVEVDSLILQTRVIPQRQVWRSKISGAEYLDEPTQWPGQWIPLLLVFGNEFDVEGKVTHSGLIRMAKDPQRLYDYSRTAFAERIALAPKTPWVAAEGQVEDYEELWKTANTGTHSVLTYKPTSINGTPVPPPSRTTGVDVPAGFAQDMQLSEHDIQSAMGMYSASIGAPSNERSGKAIIARQREGDVGTFHYHDNLNRAIKHCGRILVDLIPKFYDTRRVVRILGQDGTPDEARLDPQQATASVVNGAQSIYNLGVGRYDVSISTGPSYNTMRQEAAESMGRLVENNAPMMNLIGDILFKNMDWPGAQELAQRMKLVLPPEIRQAEEQKLQGKLSPELQSMMARMQQMVEQKDQSLGQALDMLEQLQGQLKDAVKQLEDKDREYALKEGELGVKRFEAKTRRLDVLGKEELTAMRQAVTEFLQQVDGSLLEPQPAEHESELDDLGIPAEPMPELPSDS